MHSGVFDDNKNHPNVILTGLKTTTQDIVADILDESKHTLQCNVKLNLNIVWLFKILFIMSAGAADVALITFCGNWCL